MYVDGAMHNPVSMATGMGHVKRAMISTIFPLYLQHLIQVT